MKKVVLITAVLVLFFGGISSSEVVMIRSLKDALEIGLRNNRDLKQKMLDILSSQKNIKSSLADLILPSVVVSGKFSILDPKTLENSISKISGFNVIQTNIPPFVIFETTEKTITNAFWDNYSLSVSVSYRLPYLLPFGLDVGYNSYLLQLKNNEVSTLQYEKALNDYVYNLQISYYNYLISKEVARIAIETDKRLEENVKVAESNYRAGLISDLDLIRARVQFVNNKPNLIASLNNVEIQKLNFISLLGLDVNQASNVIIEGDINDIDVDVSDTEIDVMKLKEEVVEGNLDLKILRKLLEVAQKSKDISLSANKPTLSAFFNFNYDFKKTNNIENERAWVDSWVAGFQLNIPFTELLPFSKSYANMESADISIEKAKINYETTLNIILLQIDQIVLNLKQYLQSIDAQKANILQAKRSLDITTQRYKLGNASSLDLLDADLAYQQAQLNYLNSVSSYISSKLAISRLLGKLVVR